MSQPVNAHDIGISDQELEGLRTLASRVTGIALGPQKRQFLQARLGRRLRALGLRTYSEYLHVLAERDPGGREITRFVNAVTTNETGFFREGHHFQYLAETWVPALRARATRGAERSVRVWSAACSTGEEPYTIAMTIMDALGSAVGWDVRILASDIDTDVLECAAAGLYSGAQAAPVPEPLLRRHFLQATSTSSGFVQVRPELRTLVTFRRLNFLDDPWPIRVRFDAIFCRNVLIYFDRPTQTRILERLMGYLKEEGLLFLGHSEGVRGRLTGLRHLGETIYQRASSRVLAAGAGA